MNAPIKQLCEANIRLFKYLQVWPRYDNDKTLKTRIFLVCILLGYLYFTVFYSFIYTTITSRIRQIIYIELIGLCLGMICTCSVIIIMIKNRPIISSLIDRISDFRSFGKPQNSDVVERKCNKIAFYFTILFIMTVLVHVFSGPFTLKACLKEEAQLHHGQTCGFALPTWLPIRIHSNILLAVLAILQSFGGAWTMGISGAGYILIVTSAISIAPKTEHLNKMLSEAFIDTDTEIQKQKLKVCIMYHNHIIDLIKVENEQFRKMYFIIIFVASLSVSVLLFHVLVDKAVRSVGSIVLWVTILFSNCYAGQRLVDQSNSIAEAVYSTNWTDVDLCLQKDILFMLMRAQKLMVIKPFGFTFISYITFQTIMAKIYSITSVLSQTL